MSLVALPACGQGSSTTAMGPDDAAGFSDGASTEGGGGDSGGSGGHDSGGGGGPVACAVDAGNCSAGQVCLQSTFINGLPRPPDSGPPPAPSVSYSCVADPCAGSPDASCYCTLCNGGGMCDSSPGQVSCTTESVCASGRTLIATANGPRPLASIRVGDLVYSADHGALRLVPVERVGRVAVFHHRVVELTLDSGAVLRMSAGHPMADGRPIGVLPTGARLDTAVVVARRDVAYDEPYTYDILPRSDTGSYVAAGILVGSTLAR
ncbi:MAG: Hint domain-containing protein [Polyangiaceae bacterium]